MNIFVLLAVTLSVLTHIRWFFPGVFSYGDWWYTHSETIREWSNIDNIGIWNSYSGFGSVDPQLYFFPLNLLRGMFSFLPHVDYWGLFFVYFFPMVVLPPIASYLLIKKFIPDNLAAFVGSIAYTFATYFLTLQSAHLTIGLAYAFAPVLIIAIVNFLQDQKNGARSFIFAVLAVSFAIIIEPRIFYILIIFLLPCFLFLRTFFFRYVLLGFFVILLNLFWILPLLHAGTEEVVHITDRPLFGNQFRSLEHAITGVQSAWSWYGPKPFELQKVNSIFWLIPIFVFTGLFFVRGQLRPLRSVTIFIYAVALCGIFLAKQSHAPFPDVYEWLYNNFPGFSLYRESSKFHVLIALSYAYLIAFTFFAISSFFWQRSRKHYKTVRITISCVLLSLFVFPSISFMTGQFGAMLVHRDVHEDYDVYKDLLSNKEDFFRTQGVPRFPRWGMYSAMHPKLDLLHVIEHEWEYFFDQKSNEGLSSFFERSYFGHLLDVSNVRYMFVPVEDLKNENDEFFINGERIGREGYIRALDAVDDVDRVDSGTTELVVYENHGYMPRIYARDSMYNVEKVGDIEKVYDIIMRDDDDVFDIATNVSSEVPMNYVSSIFHDAGVDNGKIHARVRKNSENDLYFHKSLSGDNLHINGKKASEFFSSNDLGGEYVAYDLDNDDHDFYEFFYEDSHVNHGNMITNPSFESGMWTKDVGDCNNYDDDPELSMRITEDGTNGQYALELGANNHIACTSQDIVDLKGGGVYVFEFDYQSDNAREAGYSMNFNGNWDNAIKEQIPIEDGQWHTFSRYVHVPNDVEKVSLNIYGFSDTSDEHLVVRYDNFHFMEVPVDGEKVYFLSKTDQGLSAPRTIEFFENGPTRKTVNIRGVSGPFYLVMSDAFHDQWKIYANDKNAQGFFDAWWPFSDPRMISDHYHFRYMSFLNGWYIDPEDFCQENDACEKKENGDYDMNIVIEFYPQRWFYLGVFISGSTFFFLCGYLFLMSMLTKITQKNER